MLTKLLRTQARRAKKHVLLFKQIHLQTRLRRFSSITAITNNKSLLPLSLRIQYFQHRHRRIHNRRFTTIPNSTNNTNNINNTTNKPLVIDPSPKPIDTPKDAPNNTTNGTTTAPTTATTTVRTHEAPKFALHDEASPIDYGEIYRERTEVTSSLWRLRDNLVQPTSQTKDPTNLKRAALRDRSPTDSLIEVHYSFQDNPRIRNEYTRFDGGVRLEKILEDMDALAGNVAMRHSDNNDSYPITFVTASVDRIDMQRRMPMNRNLIMQGRVIYVGRSSANVRISIYDRDNPSYIILNAYFIMVAKDDNDSAVNYGKAITINGLELVHKEDKKLYLRGKFDGEIKKQRRNNRLQITPPTVDETQIIHQIWLDSRPDIKANNVNNTHNTNRYVHSVLSGLQSGLGSINGLQASDMDNIWNILFNNDNLVVNISKTRVEHVTLCQPQEMNRAGKIFGGYLMKGAYELARTCAYKFAGGTQSLDVNTFDIDKHPVFVSSDEISFVFPVSVGSIIQHEAYVACTDMMDYMFYRENRIRRAQNVSKDVIDDINDINGGIDGGLSGDSGGLGGINSEGLIKSIKKSVEQEINERHCMCIVVRTKIQEPGSNELKLSNMFIFTFCTPGKGLKQVLPTTYQESMVYLYGRRALNHSREIALRDHNLLAQFLY